MSTSSTSAGEATITLDTWRRFAGALSNFATCEVRGRAGLLAAALLALLFGINGLNVVNSYVGRDFMTAIEHRDRSGFTRYAIAYVVVFGASTVAAVLFRFCEERLGLLWRDWLTRRLVSSYLAERAFHRLSLPGGLANPDQRIAEDVRTFVTMTLSLCLMFLNGTVTVLAFSGVLWSISPTLFFVGIGYAAAGSVATVLLGRRLVPLNYRQADREADFRAELIHVRENAESVALLHREPFLESRLLARIDALVANLKHIIAVNRNVGFFTTGYNYLIQIIPALIVAPLFIAGETQFGTITQAAMAFSQLLGAFSLVVTQFGAISSYAAVLARLNALAEAVQPRSSDAGAPRIVQADDHVAFEHVTLRAPRDARVLVDDLTATIPSGTRVLVRSADSLARQAIVEATAGMWPDGSGTIARPKLGDIAFLPERPFVPPGTLREVLLGNGDGTHAADASDADVHHVLATLGIDELVQQNGGLDREESWTDILSLREQQLLSIARVVLTRPHFVFLDHPGRTLDAERIDKALSALCACRTTCVTVASAEDEAEHLGHYDALLEIGEAGRFRWRPIREGNIVQQEAPRASLP
ncbi:ABC transporter ATP-binding protein/permease [Candidatus Binatia bacterium]|nr:ABC transporter ATP-binding protein/permease [Candidatus Binatia bacterium]